MKCERPGDLQVGGHEGREPLCIAWPYVLAVLVLYRVREAGVNIEHRHDGQLPRSFNVPPDEESIWRVKRKPAAAVRLNDGLWIVAEEQKWVVQRPIGPGVHIGGVDQESRTAIARRSLELTIGVITSVGKSNDAGLACAYRRYDEVLGRIAIFVAHANAETVGNLSLQLHIPGSAARVLQTSGDAIDVGHRAGHLAIRVEVRYCTVRERFEDRKCQRHAIVENAAASLEQRLPVIGQCEYYPGARRGVRPSGNAVRVRTESERKRKAMRWCPLVGDVQRRHILVDTESSWPGEGNPFDGRTRRAN